MVLGEKHKILILSGDLGDGHVQAAAAIAEAAKRSYPGAETVSVNFSAVTHPKLHHVGRYCYTQWVTKFPAMYGYLFQKTRRENTISQIFKKMKFYAQDRLVRVLEEVRPTVIVSTFAPAAAGISMLKANGLTDLPAVTVITDHTDHSYWLHPYTDRYVVASESVRDALIGNGVPKSQIAVTGIPIRPQFHGVYNKSELRSQFGLDPALPVVLVMGGGLGIIAKECSAVLHHGDILESAQFVFVCGRNEKLRKQLDSELTSLRGRFIVKGYVDNIHEWMAVSDLLVTKPGGLTTSEAIAMELPMLLYRPLPGQEHDNADFLVRSGISMKADDENEFLAHLARVLRNPAELGAYRGTISLHQRKHAALQALTAILEAEHSTGARKLREAVYARA